MRERHKQGQPYDIEFKRTVVALMKATGGNLSKTQRLIKQAGKTICYPTLQKWAREAKIKIRGRGRPQVTHGVSNRVEEMSHV